MTVGSMDGVMKIVHTLKMRELFVSVPITLEIVSQPVISITDTSWTKAMGVVNAVVNAKPALVLPKIARHVHQILSLT